MTSLDPYAGSSGELFVIRDEDLCYVPATPEDEHLTFSTAFPGPGTCTLFLRVRHRGRVEHAVFRHRVGRSRSLRPLATEDRIQPCSVAPARRR